MLWRQASGDKKICSWKLEAYKTASSQIIYHKLQPINPPYTLLQEFFGHEYLVGFLDEEKILPLGKDINVVGLCSLRNGMLKSSLTKIFLFCIDVDLVKLYNFPSKQKYCFGVALFLVQCQLGSLAMLLGGMLVFMISIEYCDEKINELVAKLENEQKVTLKENQQNASIIFFSIRVVATSVSQSLHVQTVDMCLVFDAPEPCQLLWPNLKIKYFQRQIRQYMVYCIVALAIFFYMISITFIFTFTTLKNLVKLLPFLKSVVKIIALRIMLEAYLPQIELIVFLTMLPKLLMFLSKLEGIPTESNVVRTAYGKYFYFTVLSVFIGVTL
ncbi:hypothetical protein RYX36_035715 [Vicia faba]